MTHLTKDNVISNVYYDLETGYGSAKKRIRPSFLNKPSITIEDVQTWLKQQPNKQRKGYRSSRSYTAPFARSEYHSDIMHMINLHKSPKQPKYALVVIDI